MDWLNHLAVKSTLLLFAFAINGACSQPVQEPSSRPAPDSQPLSATAVATDSLPDVVTVGTMADYPRGCHPRDVADLVLSFFTAYNAGDIAGLEQVFAGYVEWYSDTKVDVIKDGTQTRLHFVTYDRDEMFPYFATRHAQRDRLQLLWLRVVPKTWHGGVDIVYALQRRADDLAPGPDGATRIGMGKGAVQCPERKIFVWSMATAAAGKEETDYVSTSCAQEPTPPDVVVVCGPPAP